MSKRLLAALTLVCLSLTGCGYQGQYRYPCQDPANWELSECNPPECEASQTCTKDVIKVTPTTPEQEITNG
jgi:predicted small lipoprotein YifL